MTYLDQHARDRLAELRATDAIGVYASDDPSTGQDPAGAVTVTVDAVLRVVAVDVHRADAVRDPAALRETIDAAYGAAVAARLPRAEAVTRTGPPVARGLRLDVRRPTAEQLAAHRLRRQGAAEEPRGPRTTAATGVSDNDCLTVTLPPAGPRGLVDADPGWLAQAPASKIRAALVQAFAAAYTERDAR